MADGFSSAPRRQTAYGLKRACPIMPIIMGFMPIIEGLLTVFPALLLLPPARLICMQLSISETRPGKKGRQTSWRRLPSPETLAFC